MRLGVSERAKGRDERPTFSSKNPPTMSISPLIPSNHSLFLSVPSTSFLSSASCASNSAFSRSKWERVVESSEREAVRSERECARREVTSGREGRLPVRGTASESVSEGCRRKGRGDPLGVGL